MVIPSTQITDNAERPAGKRARTREHILDAAVTCFAALGIAQCNMVDIAERAEIGRSTLYRHFPKLEDIVIGVILRDLSLVIAQMADLADSFDNIEDKIIESYIYLLREFPQRPVLHMLFIQDPELVKRLSLEVSEFNELGARFSAGTWQLAKAQQRLRDGVTLEEFVEWSTHCLISLAGGSYSHTDDSTRLRQYLRRFLLPSLLTDC